MSHTSPATYLVWSIISCILFSFLVFHLWSFDRFKCLKWSNGAGSGAFKRLMTYSYLTSTPLITVYSIGFAVIKYRNGYVDIEGTIMPKPYTMWPQSDRDAIFPLMLVFALGWSLEMITHLEELCFWLFLVNSGSVQQDWFKSWYFRTWAVGSVAALTYMPLVTILTRSDPLKSEAYLFLAGSLGSLSLTLWFTPILWAFPAFLKSLKSEGVDTATVVRLTKFHELNMIRVCFRFFFCVPFIILGVDGVRPHHHVNESMFSTELLTIVAAFGCAISSALTLVIFFPRSVESEIAARDATRERKRMRSQGGVTSFGASASRRYSYATDSQLQTPTMQYAKTAITFPPNAAASDAGLSPYKEYADDVPRLPSMRPNRRRGADVEMGGIDAGDALNEANLSVHTRAARRHSGRVHPMVHNFTSPIDL
ncbi:hypothetical protein MKEN_01453700 [Mycena kentingensis (nom. inval.)]|nr:hypothetical protein MKEN_01453700 [Mycena kentingensis (nom. inval.)]